MAVETCPICKREGYDMRHVGVECFYGVDSVAPTVQKQKILKDVPSEYGRCFIEDTLYVTRCCKSCRGDFLKFFGEWAKGQHVKKDRNSYCS